MLTGLAPRLALSKYISKFKKSFFLSSRPVDFYVKSNEEKSKLSIAINKTTDKKNFYHFQGLGFYKFSFFFGWVS